MKKFIKHAIKSVLSFLTILWWLPQPLKQSSKPVAFVFKVSKWKHPYVPNFLDEYEVRFVPYGKKISILKWELNKYRDKVFIIWGFSEEEDILLYADKNHIPVYRMEDGFIRSIGLGSMHTPPYSLCLDKKGMYFDSTKASDLEDLLNHYDFNQNQELMKQAEEGIETVKSLGISKYNHVEQKDAESIYGKKTKRRVLVIGQVEDDASILKGSKVRWTNNQLVNLAKNENPDAEIIYKPHPDVLTGRRPMQSDPAEIKHIAKVIEQPLSLIDSFKTIDHVYTITSLAGFEALLRGIPVTTAGAPFYSNWGLTDDRQKVHRRKRKLTLEELFAAAYILYPRYADPKTGEKLTMEETLERLFQDLNK